MMMMPSFWELMTLEVDKKNGEKNALNTNTHTHVLTQFIRSSTFMISYI